MLIQILGPGCKKCELLADHVQEAVAELRLEATVEKVTELKEIVRHGVLMTPALVVDGAVRVVGRVPSAHEIQKLLRP